MTVFHPRTRLLALVLVTTSACQPDEDPSKVLGGVWQPAFTAAPATSPAAISYRVNGDGIQMTSSTGESYDAERGGSRVVVRGAPPGTSVRVRRTPVFALREIYKRDGKVIRTTTTIVIDERRAAILEESPPNQVTIRLAGKQ